MTTEPQASTEGEWIPRYFSDFRREFDSFKEENARQHAELSVRIAQMEARLMWRGLGGLALIASLTVVAMRLLPA